MILPMTRRLFGVLAAAAIVLGLAPAAGAQDRFITVASTTSTEQSGLFDHILPMFTEKTGIEVRVIAQGTGQALETGRRGDADVLFVHARAAEEEFVAAGFSPERHPVMYNDFVVVGPDSDPAGVDGMTDVVEALKGIASAGAPFASRGDDSGTHKAERALWQQAGIEPSGGWYRETGSGMGPTLNTAAAMDAYALTDRATWLNFDNRQTLGIRVQGDDRLFNQYGVMLVNPGKFPHIKADLGQQFIDWVISPEGQQAIASYKIGGEQLFFPNAEDAGA